MGLHGMAFMAFGLALLLVESFGEIVMIRDALMRNKVEVADLTCVSEDDGAALVVNDQLSPVTEKFYNPRVRIARKISEFLPTRHWRIPECPTPDDCLANWKKTSNWNIVNSTKYPMGPVFDSRWEYFKEYTLLSDKLKHEIRVSDSGTVVFSARSVKSIRLNLCQDDLCFLASELTTAEQASATHSHFSESSCSNVTTYSTPDQSFVSEHEWRTFVFQWDKTLDEAKTYEVDRSETLIKKELEDTTMRKLWSSRNYLFINKLEMISSGPALVRFHFYKFILTEKAGSKISYQFSHTDRNFCIELLLALCSTCELSVHIVDSNDNRKFIKNISGVNETAYGKLLNWQISKLNRTLPNNFQNSTKLEIVTGMTRTGKKGRWAIGYFRKCNRVGAVRKSRKITVSNSFEISGIHAKCYKPIIRCQKLFYNENTVVSSHAEYVNHIPSRLKECLRGRGDPSCEFQYPNGTNSRFICNPSGCICAPGFRFGDCTSACPFGEHGYQCQETCESSCKNARCDKSTGFCTDGCRADQLLPPYCETNLTPPAVEDIADTTAVLYYPAELDWGKANNLSYEIKTEEGFFRAIDARLGDTSNLRMFEVTINNLTPETTYIVQATVMTTGSPSLIESPETRFTTKFDELARTTNVITSSTVNPPYSSSKDEERNLIWLIIFPLLLICSFLLFCFYRKRKDHVTRMNSPTSGQYDDTCLSLPHIDTPENDWLYDCCPHPAKLMIFENYVQMAVENGKLESEFAMLPRGLVRPCYSGSLQENKSKNRSESSIAYDDTRVRLGDDAMGFQSDYINANYIQGYRKEKAYIATQGPKSETIVDFWRMIWQEKVLVICMLVNAIEEGKTMSEQYWPETGKTAEYGQVVVLNLDQRVYAHYTYRTFQLTTCWGTKSRKVKHLQYTGWPKQGVPMYSHSIVEYLNELWATPSGPGPIVVHCSTGNGRTGTMILCDICLRYTAAEGTVDLFAEAMKMYDARANMLDNLQQYILAHLMPTQCLLLLPTKLPCSDMSLAKIEEMKKDLPAHMRRLGVSSWKDKALYPSKPPSLPNPEHLAKNRFPKFTPVEHSLVKLKRYPRHDSSSEYISAIGVDGITAEQRYLASQLPLPSTLSDFWRLVAEKKVELVVILQRPDPNDVSCIDIIPREAPLNPVPYITVETKVASDSNEHFTTDQLLLTDESEKQPRTQNVTVLTCNDWGLAEDAEPPPPETLVSLWTASERVSRTEGPTLVLCHDGVTGCGLYLALSVLLERMAVEQECDVILTVRIIRRARAEFVYTKAQFEYLYDAAMYFAEGFRTYSNFV